MFGRSKAKKEAASSQNASEPSSGAIIQGFVCPMCLLSFSSSHDLEVHFQMNHDKPKVEDDEVALMQHQLAASEQSRDLMQREIARQLETIASLEATIASVTSSRNEAEVSLQKTVLELQDTKQWLDAEREVRQGSMDAQQVLERNLIELQEQLSSRPVASYVEQLQARCESSEKLALDRKYEAEQAMSEHMVEIAKLQDTLLGVKKSYKGFMDSLSHLLANIESCKESGGVPKTDLANLEPECASLLEMLSSQLQKEFTDKEQLRSALHEHELMREHFVQEKSKLEEQLANLETMQSKTRQKLLELSKYICYGGSDSPLRDNQVDNINLLEAINRSFDSLHAKNSELQSEIERNVSDEDVLRRLKHEYEATIEGKVSEIHSLQLDLNAATKRVMELEPASVEMKQRLETLEQQLSSLSDEKCNLQTSNEAQDRLIRYALEQFDGKTQPRPFGQFPCVGEGEYTELIASIARRMEELQTDLNSVTTRQEDQERSLHETKEQKAAVEQELVMRNETICRLENSLREQQDEASKRIVSLEEELCNLKTGFCDLQQSHDANLQTMSLLKSERDTTAERVTLLESQMQEQKTALDHELLLKNEALSRLEAALDTERVEASKRSSNHEDEIIALKLRLDDLQNAHDTQLQDISLLTSERNSNGDKIAQLESQLQQSKVLLEETISAAKTKETDLANVAAELETMKSRYGDAESRLLAMANDKFEMEKRLGELLQQLTDVESENRRITEQCSSLNESLVVFQSRLSFAEQALNDASVQKEKTQVELDHLRTDFESTKTSLSLELENAASAAEDLKNSLDKERLLVSQLTADVRVAQETCRSLEETNNQLSSQCKEVTDQMGTYRGRTEELEQNVAKMKIDHMADSARLRSDCDKQLETKEIFLRTQYSTLETKLRAEMAGLIARLEQSQSESQDLEDELNDLQNRHRELQLALQELGREQQNLQIKQVKNREHRWQDDSEAVSCRKCDQHFSLTLRRHHCRNCGLLFCHACSSKTVMLGVSRKPVRVCDACYKDLVES